MGQSVSQSEDPKPGDLIEFFQGSYSHWGVYVGDRNLVHLSKSGGACSDSASGEPFAHTKKGLVKKVSLSQIEEWGTYKINNMYDKTYRHRPIKEIVHDAEDMVQRSLASSCRHFAIILRYGEINMSVRIRNEEPKPGDMIEFFRGYFHHWGVYVGDGNVVHLMKSGEPSEFSFASYSSASQKDQKKGQIMKNPLSKVASGSMYIVNNKYDERYGHKSVKQIVCDAEKMVGKKVNYHLLSYNCEHFASELRYGIPRSEQVEEGIGLVSESVALLTSSAAFAFASVSSSTSKNNNLKLETSTLQTLLAEQLKNTSGMVSK